MARNSLDIRANESQLPNWCENTITIEGKADDVAAFHQKVIDNGMPLKLLGTFIPMPDELRNTTAPSSGGANLNIHLLNKYGAKDWYEWALMNWGVKWDCEITDASFSKNKKKLYYLIDTPWGPPIHGLVKISTLYPQLKFKLKFEEPGMEVKGKCEIENGCVYDL